VSAARGAALLLTHIRRGTLGTDPEVLLDLLDLVRAAEREGETVETPEDVFDWVDELFELEADIFALASLHEPESNEWRIAMNACRGICERMRRVRVRATRPPHVNATPAK